MKHGRKTRGWQKAQAAGYELLTKVREGGNGVPFIIFAGLKVPQDQLEKQRGAQVSNNDRPLLPLP